MPLYRVFYLAFLLWGLPQLVGAQQLNGTYCFGNSFERTCISFTPGNRFNYSNTGCTGGAEGVGVYTLLGNHLILSFKGQDTAKPPVVWHIDTITTQSDSVRWQFTVTDGAGEPLPGVTIRAKREEYLAIGDMDGKALMAFPKTTKDISIFVSYFGSGNDAYPITLRQDKSYKVGVWMNDTFAETVPNGTTYRYPIRNIQRNSFELKRDYKGAPFETYKKKAKGYK